MNIKIALFAAVAFASNARAAGAPAETDNPQLAQFATRVGEMLRQVAAAGRAAPAPKAADLGRHAAIQQLADETGGDLQVCLRPGHQTVMQLRGRALASPAKGAALLAVGDSHEHTARKFFAAHRGLMRLADPDHELALVHNQRDELGHQHLRFSQLYQGVPVWPAGLSAHFDQAGSLTLVDGAYVPTPELDSVKPALSGDDVVIRAKTGIAPGKNASASNPDLIVYGPVHDHPRLAWKFELTVSLLEAWLVVVDAQDGSILQRSSLVFDGQAQGSGADLFGTTRPLHVWQQGETYYLLDASKQSYNAAFDPLIFPRGVISIGDAKGASYDEVLQTGTADLVTSTAPNVWPVPAGVSAAFNFSEVYDYFLERHQRNSLDGQGGNITAFVGVGHYDNACWLGNLGLMIFGDARAWAGSLDIVGHELAHGVTQHTAGLPHENETGALSEALSDIFGEMIEARTRGHNDWLIGSELIQPLRNLENPAALFNFDRRYPAKMSDYLHDPNDRDHDWGGVHVNSTIIGHAFYLLAEGPTGAIGLRSAESIVYRCQTRHLFAQSEFVDFRLGCVASAEELFGPNSTEARLTAQAFDAVEIFATPGTPEPTPIPTVAGPDSTLFVYYDVAAGQYNLGRREAAQGDNQYGSVLAKDINRARPAVTGDGSIALFVSPDSDLCAVNTADFNSRKCSGLPGLVHSVAISPDGTRAAFVLRDKQSGEPEGRITVLDLEANKPSIYNLVAPIADGVDVDTVIYADSMTFSTDGTALIYDALSQLKFNNGPTVQRWSIYSLHLDSGQTSILVAPRDGVDSGNPAVGRAGSRYVVYDALQAATEASSIMVLDLFTGQAAEVATAQGGFANPAFLGDEGGVSYSAADPNAFATGRSLFKQDLTEDRLHGQGNPTLWYQDANLGIIYRRGDFQASNALPTVSLTISADQIPAQGTITLTATATDPDGTIGRVEFYDGSTKLAQAETAPYSFEWQKVPAGNHLLIARAVDNLGGTKDSSPRFLTVTRNGNKPPTITLRLSSDKVSAHGTVTLNATATDLDGTVSRVEFYDDSTKLGQVETAPFIFAWQDVPTGNYLLTARAIDNVGAETDSSPRFLTVGAAPLPQDNKPEISLSPTAKNSVRLTVSGPPGYYIISMSEDLRTWVDIYPVTIEASGVGNVDDSGGPLLYSHLFYRVRLEP